ncbi:ML domain-containing protein [Gaertneriomyces semiglobifer]|nr:ML domain-containing protein [Gaertneriomyces semiglobifer]
MLVNSLFTVLAASLATVAVAAPLEAQDFVSYAVADLAICPGTTGTLTVNDLTLTPNPVISGGEVTITATGIVGKEITEGTKAKLTVKSGILTLLNEEIDICASAAQSGIKCPIPLGPSSITFKRLVPAALPAGSYTLRVDAKHTDGTGLVCFTGPLKAVKA